MQCRNRSATQRCQHNFQMHIKHSRICCSSVAILICLLASGIAKTNAVPTDSAGGAVAHGLRTLRDVSAVAGSAAGLLQEEPKDAASTETAADQPQGQCLLDGVLVAETSVSCEKQVGCRAIQKTGHCCPDYKCDCEKDGKTYLNGDKLVDPETPCTVCYCQGGEILCSSVTCFIRDDCKPKYIAGRCCPAYDNCPVSIFDNNNGGANTTLLQPLVPAPAPAPAPALPVELLNPKITIKEITKPIEIRITDDNKAIPIHQMLKPSSTSTAAPASSTTAAPVPSPSPAPTTTTATAPALASTTTSVDEFAFGESSPATTVVNPDSNRKAPPLPVGGINTESLKLTASVAYANQVFDRRIPSPAQPAAESLSKSDASVEDSAEAPQSGNPADGPISVFGPQGLQHVDSDTAGDPSKVNIKRENLAALEVVPGANTPSGDSSDFGSSEVIYAQPGTVAAEQSGSLQQPVVDLEPDTAGSDNIYHIILTTAGPRVDPSTDGFPPFRSSTEGIDDASVPTNSNAAVRVTMGLSPSPLPQSTTNAPNILDNSTPARTDSTLAVPSTTQGSAAAPEPSTTDNAQTASSTEANKPSTDGAHHLEEEEAAMPVEANPAYPSLPEDDFSLRDVNFPLSETDDAVEPEIKDEPRSIGGAYDVAKSTKHLLNHSAGFGSLEGSGSGSGAGMLTESDVSAHIAASRPTEGAPGNIALLLNSAEDLSAETTITNSSDFQLKNIMKEAENETGSGDSLESQSLEALISSESGSGELAAAEIAPKSSKQREPTTPRPTRRTEADLDIDELDNSSGDGKAEPLEDPKLDAESLKLDDSQEDGVVQQDAAGQSDVLTVKTHAAQEQAVAEEEAAHDGVGGPRLLLQRYI